MNTRKEKTCMQRCKHTHTHEYNYTHALWNIHPRCCELYISASSWRFSIKTSGITMTPISSHTHQHAQWWSSCPRQSKSDAYELPACKYLNKPELLTFEPVCLGAHRQCCSGQSQYWWHWFPGPNCLSPVDVESGQCLEVMNPQHSYKETKICDLSLVSGCACSACACSFMFKLQVMFYPSAHIHGWDGATPPRHFLTPGSLPLWDLQSKGTRVLRVRPYGAVDASIFIVYVKEEDRRRQMRFWTLLWLNMLPALMQILHLFCFNLWSILSICQIVPTRRCSHFIRDLDYDCQSVCLWEKKKMSAASHLLPFLSMSARASVRIHHASLGVDQGENTSLFLLALPPSAPLALI